MKSYLFLLGLLLAGFSFNSSAQNSKQSVDSIRSFLKTMQDHPEITRVQDILPYVSKDVWANTELKYKSDSAQEASLDNPRVIAFSDRFVITFNGDPHQEGFDTLEMAEFVSKPKPHFSKFSYVFSGDTQKMRTAQKNPHAGGVKADCQSCHFKDWRPNWDEYGTTPNRLEPGGSEHIPIVKQKWEEFYKNKAKHARYKFVEEGKESFIKIFGSLNQTRIVSKILSQPDVADYKYAILASVGGCTDIETFLPHSASEYNLKSFSELLRHQTEVGTKNLLRKISEDVPDRDSYLKYLHENQFTKDMYNDFKEQYGQKEADSAWLGVLAPDFPSKSPEAASWYGVAQLRYVAQWMGMSMEDWSMVPQKGVYGFRTPASTFVPSFEGDAKSSEVPDLWKGHPISRESLFVELAKGWNLEKEVLKPYVAKKGEEDEGPYGYVLCDELKTKSLALLKDKAPPIKKANDYILEGTTPKHSL